MLDIYFAEIFWNWLDLCVFTGILCCQSSLVLPSSRSPILQPSNLLDQDPSVPVPCAVAGNQ